MPYRFCCCQGSFSTKQCNFQARQLERLLPPTQVVNGVLDAVHLLLRAVDSIVKVALAVIESAQQ